MNDSEFLVKLGARIKKIRGGKNMSQLVLASACNFEKASMSRIESGLTNTTVLTLRKIANALNVDMAELFKD